MEPRLSRLHEMHTELWIRDSYTDLIICRLNVQSYIRTVPLGSKVVITGKIHSLELGLSKTTRLTHDPTPSSETSTSSPSFSHNAGLRPMPTPWGLSLGVSSSSLIAPLAATHVPVKIRSPGWSVVPWDRKAMVLATWKIMSLVDEDWTVFPFNLVEICRALGSLITLEETIPGPNGAHPSKPFPCLLYTSPSPRD